MKFQDLTGQKFNRLTVMRYWGLKGTQAAWECVCECGGSNSVIVVRAANLKCGGTQSCGCYKSDVASRRRIDRAGTVFGEWTAIKDVGRYENNGDRLWLCKCSCGQTSTIAGASLRSGLSKSCGCKKGAFITAGLTKHGRTSTPEYRTWSAMRGRCCNPKNKSYYLYGGRGIRVCSEWLESFETFFADMGPRPSTKHSIDRIATNGNYEKSNCRWATPVVQARNRRLVRHVKFNGQALTIMEWSEITGIDYSTIKARLKRKWPAELALTIPTIDKHRGGRHSLVLEGRYREPDVTTAGA
jgi:hypothetical protein